MSSAIVFNILAASCLTRKSMLSFLSFPLLFRRQSSIGLCPPIRSAVRKSSVKSCLYSPRVYPSSHLETLFQAIHRAPHQPGVYRFLDAVGTVLYVGKAKKLNARLRQYICRDDGNQTGVAPSAGLSPSVRVMITEARTVDYVITDSEAAALALEAAMVNELRPPFNVLLKDDRRHPFALITFSERYPRIVISRNRKSRRSLDRLYGPFVDESRLRHVLNAIHTVFPLRQRRRPLFSDRPCINYDLGRCPGVCQELVSPEEYGATVAKVDKLLSGRVNEVLNEMCGEMQVLSDAMLYERAAEVRDNITTLERTFFVHGDVLLQESEAAATIIDGNPSTCRDLFAIACTGSIGKVVLFQVRGGKLISRLIFSVSRGASSDQTHGEMLSAVMASHYSEVVHAMEVPEEVLLCEEATEMEILRTVLSEKRGKSVSVRLVGTKARAIGNIAQKNADMEVRLEAERAKDIEKDVHKLEVMLSPFYPSLFGTNKIGDIDSRPGSTDDLKLCLHRIECYDISHTSGSNAVGAMSVFTNGVADSSEYRRFNLGENVSSQGHPDDYESIRETLRRRFRKSTEVEASATHLPDLVVIDGGKGQLSAASNTLAELGIRNELALISIAKAEEAIFVEGITTSINFDEDSGQCIINGAVRLVCRLRDEAHKTAVGAHRKRRGKQALRSGLDSVPGLGNVKRSALLENFNGSAEAISQASAADLQTTNGIGPALARRIFEHFHVQCTGSRNEQK